MGRTVTFDGLQAGQTITVTPPTGEPIKLEVPAGSDALTIQTVDPLQTRGFDKNNPWDYFEFVAWAVAGFILLGFALLVLKEFYKRLDAASLISEPDGKASLSRFQALLFTFVFVIALALIVVRTGDFPTEIPLGVWALLAGSLGTFLASKGLQLGMAPSVPTQSPGPMIRYGAGAVAVFPKAPNPPPPALPAQFLIQAGVGSFGPSVTVAVAVGGVTLKIEGTAAGETALKGRVNYLQAGAAAPADVDFTNSTTIVTDSAALSEVRVQWNATQAAVVKTNVS